jgi:soluble lytic murein transglycosylase-like protein
MSPSGLIALLLLAALPPVAAAAATEPASACLDAAAVAERAWMLPPDLVAAIGRVESGRVNQATGRVIPWPWTVNANGSGNYFATRMEAVEFVRSLQANGVRVIDVGCFQVDLFYHPAAFASLEEAFDPAANADYAARFLTALHAQTGSWPAAVARYHSGLALEGEGYRVRVMSQLGSGGSVAGTAAAPSAGRGARLQPAADRYVVLMSAAARAIRVIGP